MKEIIEEARAEWSAHKKIEQQYGESRKALDKKLETLKGELFESVKDMDVDVEKDLDELYNLASKLAIDRVERLEIFNAIQPFLNYNLRSTTEVLCEGDGVKLVAGSFGLGVRHNVQSRQLRSYGEFELFIKNKEAVAQALHKIDSDYCGAFEAVCSLLSGYLQPYYNGVVYELNEPITVLSHRMELASADKIQIARNSISLKGKGFWDVEVMSSNCKITNEYDAMKWHTYVQLRPHLEYIKVRMREMDKNNLERSELKNNIVNATAKWVLMASI